VSLVGYTNAGKSTLLNHLTQAGVLVEDRLFSTLDPTARRLRLPDGRPVVLTDTVGFIRKLPHGLVEAFQSTLEEVSGADVLVHVVDASRAEPEVDVDAVEVVLAEIGATEAPRILALNKVDLLEPVERARVARRFPSGVPISAVTGDGVDQLLEEIGNRLRARVVEVEAVVPYDEGTLLARLHDDGRVVSSAHTAEGVRVLVRARTADLHALAPFLIEPPPELDGDGAGAAAG
jgi:GTP-binding protein HflX